MSTKNHYRPYRASKGSPGKIFSRLKPGRVIVVVVAVLLLVWVVRAKTNNDSDAETSNTPAANTNTVIPALLSQLNANTNTIETTNTNTASTPATTTAGCTGVISTADISAKRVALTFNSGVSSPGSTEKIRDALKAGGAGGTFFLSGTWVDANPTLAKSLSEAGFQIGNYTFDRPHPAALTAEGLTVQLTQAESAIVTATGKNPKPYFRPPFGEFNDQVTKIVSDAGYCIIHWTVDAYDWQDDQTVDTAAERVKSRSKPGAIVLMNIASDIVDNLVPRLITDLKADGYELVTIDQLFR